MVVIAVAWPLVGAVAGAWMARRGYSPLWTLLAAPLGPLFIPIAAERVRRRPAVAAFGTHGPPPGRPAVGTGPRILVGLDGSAESGRALSTALRLVGPQCGLLVLAEVVRHEAVDDSAHADIDAAAGRLAEAAARVASEVGTAAPVHTEVLTGPPGPALRGFAAEQDMDLLVVGRRGAGASARDIAARLLGRVSSDLVENSTVPVLVTEPSGERG